MDTDRDDFEGDPAFAAGLLADGTPAFPDLDEPDALSGSAPMSDEIDDQTQDDISSLLLNGTIPASFTFAGYDFVIRTLKSGEDLAAALITKRYEGTLGEGKALTMATMAISIVTVDGEPLTRPLGPGEQETITSASRNFHYIGRKWAWPIVEVLYVHYSDLKLRENAALKAMEGKSAAGLLSS